MRKETNEYVLSETPYEERLVMIISDDGTISFRTFYWGGDWKPWWRDGGTGRHISLDKEEVATMKKYLQ